MAPDFPGRIRRFHQELERIEVDEFVATHPPNLFYLFGFSGSTAAAYTRRGETTLIVDSRYLEQARAETRGASIHLAQSSAEAELSELLRESGSSGTRVGFESTHLTYREARWLMSRDPSREWVPAESLVENLRMIKDREEIERIRRAFRLAQQAFAAAASRIRTGMGEREIAGLLELEMRRCGGDGTAFDTIVASGPRSALPHAMATSRRWEPGEHLLVDFGIRYCGYNSDLTRLVFPPGTGKPEILAVVNEARQAALEMVRPGAQSSEVDAAARQVIAKHGYGDFFGHSTGHGLGLEVHELPYISGRRSCPLAAGMVFTIEPGIYLPGRYGVRLEDAVVVTPDGYSPLSVPDP